MRVEGENRTISSSFLLDTAECTSPIQDVAIRNSNIVVSRNREPRVFVTDALQLHKNPNVNKAFTYHAEKLDLAGTMNCIARAQPFRPHIPQKLLDRASNPLFHAREDNLYSATTSNTAATCGDETILHNSLVSFGVPAESTLLLRSAFLDSIKDKVTWPNKIDSNIPELALCAGCDSLKSRLSDSKRPFSRIRRTPTMGQRERDKLNQKRTTLSSSNNSDKTDVSIDYTDSLFVSDVYGMAGEQRHQLMCGGGGGGGGGGKSQELHGTITGQPGVHGLGYSQGQIRQYSAAARHSRLLWNEDFHFIPMSVQPQLTQRKGGEVPMQRSGNPKHRSPAVQPSQYVMEPLRHPATAMCDVVRRHLHLLDDHRIGAESAAAVAKAAQIGSSYSSSSSSSFSSSSFSSAPSSSSSSSSSVPHAIGSTTNDDSISYHPTHTAESLLRPLRRKRKFVVTTSSHQQQPSLAPAAKIQHSAAVAGGDTLASAIALSTKTELLRAALSFIELPTSTVSTAEPLPVPLASPAPVPAPTYGPKPVPRPRTNSSYAHNSTAALSSATRTSTTTVPAATAGIATDRGNELSLEHGETDYLKVRRRER